jgi:hypothetical protein
MNGCIVLVFRIVIRIASKVRGLALTVENFLAIAAILLSDVESL